MKIFWGILGALVLWLFAGYITSLIANIFELNPITEGKDKLEVK